MYDNAPFRTRYKELEEKEGLSLTEVAARCGWLKVDEDGKEKCDSSRVGRQLGLTKEGGKYRTEVNADVAKVFCDALHIDYTDIPDL